MRPRTYREAMAKNIELIYENTDLLRWRVEMFAWIEGHDPDGSGRALLTSIAHRLDDQETFGRQPEGRA